MGAFATDAASVFTDRVVPLGEAVGADEATLIRQNQAHLIRDFRAAIGRTPAAYAESQSPRWAT